MDISILFDGMLYAAGACIGVILVGFVVLAVIALTGRRR